MTHKALEDYFHSIINKPIVKETTMFDQFKVAVANAQSNFLSLWTKPVEFVDNSVEHDVVADDYWGFEMYTHEWIDECNEVHPVKHTMIIEPHDTTWMEVLDRILDEMEKHYGYNIKEQVYYSVNYPLNEINERTGLPFAGYGRSLNDEVFQQLLLAYPEVYKAVPFGGEAKKGVFE